MQLSKSHLPGLVIGSFIAILVDKTPGNECHLSSVDALSALPDNAHMSDVSHDLLLYFGQIVRARRINLSLTQEGLAEKSGLHRTYIADIERGTRNVSLLNIAKLAQGLSCSVSSLLSEIDKVDA